MYVCNSAGGTGPYHMGSWAASILTGSGPEVSSRLGSGPALLHSSIPLSPPDSNLNIYPAEGGYQHALSARWTSWKKHRPPLQACPRCWTHPPLIKLIKRPHHGNRQGDPFWIHTQELRCPWEVGKRKQVFVGQHIVCGCRCRIWVWDLMVKALDGDLWCHAVCRISYVSKFSLPARVAAVSVGRLDGCLLAVWFFLGSCQVIIKRHFSPFSSHKAHTVQQQLSSVPHSQQFQDHDICGNGLGCDELWCTSNILLHS